jgi:transposase
VVVYVYAPDRKAERPITHLAGFHGVLQVDGYAGYRKLAEGNAVTLAFCWAHVRRRFYELATAGSAPIASEALARIAELYRIEGDIRGQSADARRAVRLAKSKPVVDALEPWLRDKLLMISQKTKLAEAISYALSRWEGLYHFLEHGHVEIDSNVVERSIRPIALTRKNALFAGSDGGAETWAIVASLIECCKLVDVEPYAYLADVTTRVVNGHRNRHSWTNRQVESMNRTIKEATVKPYHYDNHRLLEIHLTDFIAAYKYERRPKTLRGLTPYEYVCKMQTEQPKRFMIDPIQQYWN